MTTNPKAVTDELARAKAYYHRHEIKRTMISMATALKAMTTLQVVGSEKLRMIGTIQELVQSLNRTEEVQKYHPAKTLTYGRGGEKQLLKALLLLLKAIQEAENEESIEATRERKLSLDHFVLRGVKSLENKKLADAEEAFQEAVKLYVDEHKLFFLIGSKLLAAGFARPSLRYLQKGIEVDPEGEQAFLLAARAYYQLDSVEKAEAVLRAAQERFGDDAERYELLGELLLRQKKIREALAAVRSALEMDPMLPRARKVLQAIKKPARPASARRAPAGE